MSEIDAESLIENAVLIGLISRQQAQQARYAATDGSTEALVRVLTRRELMTSWQINRLRKGDNTGLFYGSFKVLFHLAEGTFARVYRAIDTHTGQPAAIKVLRNRFSQDREAVGHFLQEAESGMALKHPNIVQIYDSGEQDGRHYMTMEYVEGSNLRDFLKIRHRLSGEEALPLMNGLCKGLQYAWQRGTTHRDIKGTNILISNAGVPKLVDFGLATFQEDDEKKTAASRGQRTVDYAALERTCKSSKGDPRSDIFFLGCVFYQMISGLLPMPEVESKDPLAKMLKRSFGAIKPLSELNNAPEPGICEIVEKMMKIPLDQRYGHIDEVVKDLDSYQRSLNQVEPARSPNRLAGDDLNLDSFDSVRMPTVLCVESQEAIREALRKTFEAMGFRPLIMGDPEHAVQRFRETLPDLLVFDIDGLGESSIAHYRQMLAKAQDDQVALCSVILLGPRQGQLAEQLPRDERTIILNKPLRMKEVQEAVGRLVPDLAGPVN